MDRGKLSIKELSVDELTAQAVQLLDVNVPELYCVLGFQLAGYSRPARVAGILSYHHSLQSLFQGEGNDPIAELSKGIDGVYQELKQDGEQFLESVREELHKVLCTPEILELARRRASRSRIQIIVLVIAGALKMPAEMESLAATIAAIIYKSGIRQFCKECSGDNVPVRKDKVSG